MNTSSPSTSLPKNINHGPAINAIFWTQAIVALFVVMLRLYARRTIHATGLDDYFMLITVVN